MTAHILDGKALAARLSADLGHKVQSLLSVKGRAPGLTVIRVGEDPASAVYVGNKEKAALQMGFCSKVIHLPSDTSAQTLLNTIQQLNVDPTCDGILLQLPLPPSLSADDFLEAIAPEKDVDGLHPYNLGRLAQRRPTIQPCTPKGIIHLLNSASLPIKGKEAVVVGASNIVGRPMALALLTAGATVTVCHRFTQNLSAHVARADILVVAVGKPGIIDSNWIKPGAIVIDVGINRLPDGKLCGDVPFESAKERASYVTPVPGGVGPMTIYTLLENTVAQWEKSLT